MSTKKFTTRHGIDANYQDIVSANTIYANTFNGSGTGLTSIPNSSLANSSVTINGTAISLGSSGSIVAGATITDDTSTNATRYVMLGTATSGSYTVANTSSTKLTYNPSSGILSATGFSGSGADLTGSATNLTANVATYEVINNAISGFYYPQMVSATSGTLVGYANNAFVFNAANGTVGIGTTSPSYKLDVNGTAKANTLILTENVDSVFLTVKANTTQTNNLAEFKDYNNTTLASIKSTGRFNASDGSISGAGYDFTYNSNALGMYRPAIDTLGFITTNLERVRIDANGSVGIGTTSPSTYNSIVSSYYNTNGLTSFCAVSGSSATCAIELRDGAATANRWWLLTGLSTTTDGVFSIYDKRQALSRLSIDTSGNVTLSSDLTVSGGDIKTGAAIASTLFSDTTTGNIAIAGGLTTGTYTVGATGSTGAVSLFPATGAQNITLGGATTGTITVGSTSATAVQLPTGKAKIGQTTLAQGGAVTATFPTVAGTLIGSGDTGTITTAMLASSSSTTTGVTYAKMQYASAQYRVLGRITAASGVFEELTPDNLITTINQATTALTISSTINGLTLSSTSLSSAAATNLSVNSGTTGVLTLDSGTTGAINIGTNANAKTITLGNVTGATSFVVNSGTSGVTFNQVAAGVFKVQASAAPTTDMMQITNTGQAIVTAGVNALEVTFVGGAAAVEAGAIRTGFTPGGTTGGIWNGFRMVPTAAAATGVTMNGMKFDNITAGTGTDNMIYAGTGWDNIINYNGTSVIDGSGQINASQILTGTVPGARGVTSGSASASFVTYNGTTATAGQFDGGSTTPTGTTRLNYGGYFYPTFINLVGSADTATAATHYFVETGTDGFVRPKTLTNVQAEVVTTAVLGSGTASASTYLAGDRSWKAITSGLTVTDDNTTNGNRYLLWTASTSGSITGANVSSTDFYVNPGTGIMYAPIFSSLSDIREKTNIVKIENSLDIIKNVNTVQFNWKKTGKKSYGVIAQEIEKILPEIVNEDNGKKSVEYQALFAILLDAVKELSSRVEELEKK